MRDRFPFGNRGLDFWGNLSRRYLGIDKIDEVCVCVCVCGGILRSGEGSFVLGFGRGCLLNADGEGGFGWRIKCIGNWNFCMLCSFDLYYMVI